MVIIYKKAAADDQSKTALTFLKLLSYSESVDCCEVIFFAFFQHAARECGLIWGVGSILAFKADRGLKAHSLTVLSDFGSKTNSGIKLDSRLVGVNGHLSARLCVVNNSGFAHFVRLSEHIVMVISYEKPCVNVLTDKLRSAEIERCSRYISLLACGDKRFIYGSILVREKLKLVVEDRTAVNAAEVERSAETFGKKIKNTRKAPERRASALFCA